MAEFYYFSTAWCGPCKAFKPVVQQVVAETGIPMQFVDAEQNASLAAKYNISSVPTIVVAEGGQPIYKQSGVQSKTQLAAALTRFK